jgi:plasmid stabilization system protein ParE
MALKIEWAPEAISSHNSIIDYLTQKWTEREADRFAEKVNATLRILATGKVRFRYSAKKNIYEVLVSKQNLLVYRMNAESIQLLAFFDTRQHPKKKKV